MLNIHEIIERIEEIKSNHQLSSAAFANKIGVQRSAMSHILSGRNKPSLEFLMRIYDAFDEVELDWLILGSPSPTVENQKKISFSDQEEFDPNQTAPKEIIIAPQTDKKIPEAYHEKGSDTPKEIIYLYSDGSFERYLPKS